MIHLFSRLGATACQATSSNRSSRRDVQMLGRWPTCLSEVLIGRPGLYSVSRRMPDRRPSLKKKKSILQARWQTAHQLWLQWQMAAPLPQISNRSLHPSSIFIKMRSTCASGEGQLEVTKQLYSYTKGLLSIHLYWEEFTITD